MKPFPKWFGIVSAVVAIVPAGYAAYQQGGWQALLALVITGLGAIGAVNAHSTTGTGGTLLNP